MVIVVSIPVAGGPIVAAEAAADGIDLSEATVDCISDAVRSSDFLDGFFTGDDPSDAELAGVIFGCLSPEELAQLAD